MLTHEDGDTAAPAPASTSARTSAAGVHDCPKCRQSKHANCTIAVLVGDDVWDKCPCLGRGHRDLPITPYDGGTSSGHSGSEASQERSEREDSDGTTEKRQAAALELVRQAEKHGMTVKELREGTGWHHGQASSALSNLHRVGLLERLADKRDRCQVYVRPVYVLGRETQPYGRQHPSEPPRREYTLEEIRTLTGFSPDARFVEVKP